MNRKGPTMDSRDDFIKEFDKLLQRPRDYSLEQWQYVYKQVVFSMGMQILEEFDTDVFGEDPFNRGGSHHHKSSLKKGRPPEKEGSGPGPGGGGHPYAIVICILKGVLEIVATSASDPEKPPTE
jgi:hypothetical protein